MRVMRRGFESWNNRFVRFFFILCMPCVCQLMGRGPFLESLNILVQNSSCQDYSFLLARRPLCYVILFHSSCKQTSSFRQFC